MDQHIEQAVQAYLSQMTPDQLAKSNAYFEGGYWLLLWNLVIALALGWLFMRAGWSVKMKEKAARLSRFSFLNHWFYFIQYFGLSSVLTLPWLLYTDYFREHQYGLSNFSLPAWFVEQGKGLLVTLILFGFFMSLLYAIIAKLRETWWAWGTVASVVFLLFTAMIAPVYIAPLFNTYVPLPPGEVRDQILQMARSNGVPADEVYLFDASKQSKRISANVSGMFHTTRISLNDNLLNRTSLPEIRSVMGHETGHYVLNHGFKFVVQFSLILLAGFLLIHHALKWILKHYGQKFGVTDIADPAAAPLLLALLSLFMFLATPITNSIVRSAEAEADIFGLNLARNPDGFAKVALQLSEYRKISPGYWEEIIFYDHPSGENRIRMAMKWKFENSRD